MINFTEEQTMLLETAMDFCANRSPLDKVRTQIETPLGFEKDQWQEMVDLGWLGINIPEAYGGLGLSSGDVVPVAESMGRNLMSSPFFATTLAAHTLVVSGSEVQKSEWLQKIAVGSIATVALTEADGNWNLNAISAKGELKKGKLELSGIKNFVLDAEAAELIIASVKIEDKPSLVLIEKKDLDPGSIVREVVIDETRRSYQVNLSGVSIDPSQILEGNDFSSIEHYALLLLCAEMAGGMAGVLDVIVEYLNTRKQFDRLIGSYQALKHPTVDILVGMEAARSHAYHAATVLASGDEQKTEIAMRMAKAHGSEAFSSAGDRAVQFHGGFGFTYECNAQLYLRRALWCQFQFGDERHHRQLLAPLLLDK